MIDLLSSECIKWALLITDINNEDCTEVIRRLIEKKIKFEMQAVPPKNDRRRSRARTVFCAKVGKKIDIPLAATSSLPVLILDLSKKSCIINIILEGREEITKALTLRN